MTFIQFHCKRKYQLFVSLLRSPLYPSTSILCRTNSHTKYPRSKPVMHKVRMLRRQNTHYALVIRRIAFGNVIPCVARVRAHIAIEYVIIVNQIMIFQKTIHVHTHNARINTVQQINGVAGGAMGFLCGGDHGGDQRGLAIPGTRSRVQT